MTPGFLCSRRFSLKKRVFEQIFSFFFGTN